MRGVSVVIPARNAGAFLAEALDSVFAQGLDHPEVVVVDDGSTDDTPAIARGYGRGVRLVSQPRGGSAKARNRGLAETSGEFVAFLDADDVWVEEKSRWQLPVLIDDPGLALVFSDMIGFDDTGVRSESYFRQRKFDGRCSASSIFLFDMISTPTVILRRSCLRLTGVFDESLPIGQDTDLWFRLALQFPFAVVDRPLVRRRFHAGNVTKDRRLLAHSAARIWARYLDRCIEQEPAMRERLLAFFSRLRWHHFFLEGCSLLRQGRPGEGRRFLRQAIGEAPVQWRSYAFLLASYLGLYPSLSRAAGRCPR